MHPHLSPVVSYPKWPLESDLSFNLWTLTGSVILGYLIFLSLFHYFKEKKKSKPLSHKITINGTTNIK